MSLRHELEGLVSNVNVKQEELSISSEGKHVGVRQVYCTYVHSLLQLSMVDQKRRLECIEIVVTLTRHEEVEPPTGLSLLDNLRLAFSLRLDFCLF